MRRYTDTTLMVDIGVDTAPIENIWLTFSSSRDNHSEILTLTERDVIDMTDTGFKFRLTADDTANLNKANTPNKDVYVQIRARYASGKCTTSNIVRMTITDVLKEGEIND